MNPQIKAKADQFIREETQFHLGFLPTEQSNPKSRSLEADYKTSPEKGVKCLQNIDRDVLTMLKSVLFSEQYAKLVQAGYDTLQNGGRIIYSGCGATGRLAILLEAMWRTACDTIPEARRYANSVESIMTGGDFALVKAVEFFEDFVAFGRRQVQETNMSSRDMLVAITEGGETSSVLGSLYEAADRGCKVFLLFNNPAEILTAHLERSRRAIEDPRVCVLDLYCGPMALAGSTRMQATTSEQMVAGSALETILHRLLGKPELNYLAAFEALLDSLESPQSVKAIADYTAFEANVYQHHGKVTYFANDFLLDIFTDTTERSPTFMLPPFRQCDDTTSPAPWTFVKNPLFNTQTAWNHSLKRKHRCLEWQPQDYIEMGAGDKIIQRPPNISAQETLKFLIGNENIQERCNDKEDTAVLISIGTPEPALAEAFQKLAKEFPHARQLTLNAPANTDFNVTATCADGDLCLMQHLAIKLTLNTISTGAMVMLGRVKGNWMSWVNCTNKKLLDRGARLVSELANVDYRTACETLFEAMEELKSLTGIQPSPVQLALSKLNLNP